MQLSRAFYLAWAGTAVLMAATVPWLPDTLGEGHRALGRLGYVASMGLPLLAVGACSRAFVSWLGRVAPGQVNLPNRAYWMAEPRRADTLARLGEHVSGVGLLALTVLAGAHASTLFAVHPDWPQPPQALLAIGAGVLAIAAVAWCWRVRQLFPAPEVDAAAPAPRRPRRPGESR